MGMHDLQRQHRQALAVDKSYDINPYGSHQEALVACAMRTTGPVIELGCGMYSTPILHHICRNRPLLSCDSNRDWLSRFSYLLNGTHALQYVERWDDLRLLDTIAWDVAFVDHAPAERRRVDVMRLAKTTRFIVVHDTDKESENVYGINEVLATFKYRIDLTQFAPRTSIVSNLCPVDIYD